MVSLYCMSSRIEEENKRERKRGKTLRFSFFSDPQHIPIEWSIRIAILHPPTSPSSFDNCCIGGGTHSVV